MFNLIKKTPNYPPTLSNYQTSGSQEGTISFGLRPSGLFKNKSVPGKPLVTIITIVRNGEKTIERTISSVLNQTYQNLEYIIIDGGSTDRTLDVIKRYQDKIAFCLSEPDKGIADGFNKGISHSTGELIGIINSDDWYNENTIETVVHKYLRHGEKIFHGNNQRWNESMERDYIFKANDKKILNRMTINHPTVFVPRRFYVEIGLYRLDFEVAMDYEWLRRAKISGKEFFYLDMIMTNMAPGGLSDKKWLKGYFENAKARYFHGVNLLSCILILGKMVFITVIRKFLERLGMDGIVVYYKKNYSIVKKHYH